MFGIKSQRNRIGRDEGEKPFWISFSDLMTALMVLFLVSMAVALMAVTQEKASRDAGEGKRISEISGCMADVERLAQKDEFKGIRIKGHSVEFGTLAEFQNDKDILGPNQARSVRAFVRRFFNISRSKECDKWLKRVIVEGFASRKGTYLHNLDLSFRRSQRVFCILLDPLAEDSLVLEDRKIVRRLFLAGGSSFNTELKNDDQMRRVELKLEFRELGGVNDSPLDIAEGADGVCPNGEGR
jgi:hypothetical protein